MAAQEDISIPVTATVGDAIDLIKTHYDWALT